MRAKRAAAIQKRLFPDAEERLREIVDDFLVSLLLQAKIVALQDKAEVVLSKHVDQALAAIFARRKDHWPRQIAKILGGALFGAFIPGFATALSDGNALTIVIYMSLGFVGIFLIFLGVSA